jgi:hypothetical protein
MRPKAVSIACCLAALVFSAFAHAQQSNSPHQRPMVSVTRDTLPACQYPGLVRTDFINGGERAVGSGFIVDTEDATAIVLTCAHGYKALMTVEVLTQTGQRFAAEVLGVHPINDLCVLLIANPGLPPMRIGMTPPKIGDRIYMAGFAGGKTFNGSWGAISQWVQPQKNGPATFIETTCRTAEGCSGGPLLAADGSVIGLVTGNPQACIGPCLAMTLPDMRLSKQPYSFSFKGNLDYCQSSGRVPWRKGMLAEERRTNQALGSISGQLQVLASQAQQPAPQAIAPLPPACQPGMCNVAPPAKDYGPDIARIDETLGKQGSILGELSEKVADFAKVVGLRLKILDKLETDAEQGGVRGRLAQGALNVLGASDEERESRLEGKWAKWLILLGIIVALVYWHKNKHGPVAGLLERMGKPDLANRETEIVERIENRIRGGVAAAATGNPLIGAAVSKASDIEDRLERRFKDLLEARLAPAPGQPATATPKPLGPLGQ